MLEELLVCASGRAVSVREHDERVRAAARVRDGVRRRCDRSRRRGARRRVVDRGRQGPGVDLDAVTVGRRRTALVDEGLGDDPDVVGLAVPDRAADSDPRAEQHDGGEHHPCDERADGLPPHDPQP
jgi:hypothetical protein